MQSTKYSAPWSAVNAGCYENIWVELKVGSHFSVIGAYYRHPNTPISSFTTDFIYSLDKLKDVKYGYVFGDFNVCLSNYSINNHTRSFIDAVLDANFLPYVYMPTRFTSHSSTIIDHVYSNNLFTDNQVYKTGLLINDVADHCANFMLLIDPSFKVNNSLPVKVTVINYSKSYLEKFKSSLAITDFNSVYASGDPDTSLAVFLTKFQLIHDQCFPS